MMDIVLLKIPYEKLLNCPCSNAMPEMQRRNKNSYLCNDFSASKSDQREEDYLEAMSLRQKIHLSHTFNQEEDTGLNLINAMDSFVLI